jgi:hypothetical protein
LLYFELPKIRIVRYGPTPSPYTLTKIIVTLA